MQRGTHTPRCEHVPTQICSQHVGSGAQWPRSARSSDWKPESGLLSQGILMNKTTLSRLDRVDRAITSSPEPKQRTLTEQASLGSTKDNSVQRAPSTGPGQRAGPEKCGSGVNSGP